jgi:hypothetical protein
MSPLTFAVALPAFARRSNTPRRQDSVRRHPVKGNAALEPRMPSVGSISTLRPSEASRDPCYVRAKVLASVRPKRIQYVPSRACGRSALLRPDLGLPRGSPRWSGEDASLRPLQPTHDTSTRGPFDFRARNLRCADRRMPPAPVKVRFFRAASDHLAGIQPRLGTRLTARLQLRPLAHGSASPFGWTSPSSASWTVPPWPGVVSHAQSWRTTSDAPCRAPRCHPVLAG